VNYLLDTNIISELVAARPNSKVLDWINSIESQRIFLSIITIRELNKGIQKLPDSERKAKLEAWLHNDVLSRFEHQLLALDAESMLLSGSLTVRLESLGRPISAIDALLAASALQGSYILVTRDSAHFADTGVQLHNPWQE
jgi:toxin FitB